MLEYLEKELNLFCKENKYRKWYTYFCTKIKNDRHCRSTAKKEIGYIETHHYIPISFNSSYEKDKNNLLHCSAREHFILHKLLIYACLDTKFEFKAKKAITSFMMENSFQVRVLNSRDYEFVRRMYSESFSGEAHPKGMLGKKHSTETRKKMSESSSFREYNRTRKGVNKTEEHKNKISEAHKKEIEFYGGTYHGWGDLTRKTGVSRHLYHKFYLKNEDPRPYINNRHYTRNKK